MIQRLPEKDNPCAGAAVAVEEAAGEGGGEGGGPRCDSGRWGQNGLTS